MEKCYFCQQNKHKYFVSQCNSYISTSIKNKHLTKPKIKYIENKLLNTVKCIFKKYQYSSIF